jgi:hypothetical protein
VKHVRLFSQLGVLFFLLPLLSLLGQQKKIVVGILPTYDISGQAYGPNVSQILTLLLFEEYSASSRFTPIYLNPGGKYDPSSTSFAAEYVQSLGTPVDLILSTTFVEPEDPKKGDLILHMKGTQLDPKTGDTMLSWTSSKPLKDRSAMITSVQSSSYSNKYMDSRLLYQPSREFRKQPLGKAAADLATQLVQATTADAGKFTASGEAPAAPKGTSCKMQIKVNYVEKHAISKSYTVFINDRDETRGVKEGLLDVEEKAGRLSILMNVNDKPYKLPIQDTYLFDPTLDCTRSTNFLNIDIGAAGEAVTTWR